MALVYFTSRAEAVGVLMKKKKKQRKKTSSRVLSLNGRQWWEICVTEEP